MIKKVFNKFKSKKVLTNASWIIGEQIFQMLISMIIGMISARYLGPSNYGMLSYTTSFVTFFASIANLGMEGVVIKKMIESPEVEGEYLGSCMLLRTLSSVVSIFAISLLIFVLNPTEPIMVVLALLQSFQLFFKSFQILDSWFQRHLKSKQVSLAKMIACILVAAYRIYILVTAKSIVWFAVTSTLTDLIVSLVLCISYKKHKTYGLALNLRRGWEVLKESYHFILSGLMVAIYSQMDRIMIGEMLSTADVGLYTAATTIAGTWVFIPTAVINSFRPMVMEAKGSGDEKRYILRLEQLYSLIIWFCLGVSVVISVFSPLIVNILYGDAYGGAASALSIAIWFETFAMIGTARGIWIICENKNRYVKYYLLMGVAVNLVLNYLLIPIWGIDGASIATLMTQVTTSIIAPLFYKDTKIHTKYVWEAFIFRWYFERKRNHVNENSIEKK